MRLIFLTAVVLWAICCFSQPQVQYGSAQGTNVTVFGTKIYLEEYGKGTPLLLLQGGMGSIADFKFCIPELSKHFRVIAPDTPGQGRSELADSMSYQLIAAYFSSLMDQLKLDSVYILGWSDGGIAGLLLAEKRPDKVKKVIAVGANYTLKGAVPLGTDLSKVKADPVEGWEKRNKNWIENYQKMLPRDWKKYYRDITRMWYQQEYFSSGLLKRITIPVMIAQGDRDHIQLEHAAEMHRLIKGSQLCVLPNTSHAVFREKPRLINQIAIDFFSH